jgi:hypothetical protein
VVACSLVLMRALGLVSGSDLMAPSDVQWQQIFVLAKAVNVTAMSFVLVFASLLLTRWLARGGALLWCLGCAMSMALVSEVYQLRNEFYSSFLAILAILIALNGAVSMLARHPWRRCAGGRDLAQSGLASVGCLWLAFLAVLAKVQVVPVLLSFVIVISLALVCLREWRFLWLYWISSFVGACCVALGFSSSLVGVDVSVLQVVVVLTALVSPAALSASAAWLAVGGLAKMKSFSAAVLCVALTATSALFAGFAANAGWIGLLANPLSTRSHAVATARCEAGSSFCVVKQGVNGILYLFERSVDAHALAPWIAVLVISGALIVTTKLLVGANSLFQAKPSTSLASLAALGCLGVAFLMAFIAGQRWTVDHYLSYQQPFLLAALIVLASQGGHLGLMWRGVVALSLVSVLLVFVRYPLASRSTYVKESILEVPVVGRGDGSLCADQHAGDVWRRSSLWELCDGFIGAKGYVLDP